MRWLSGFGPRFAPARIELHDHRRRPRRLLLIGETLASRFGRALKTGTPLDGARPFAAVSLASWILVLLAGRSIAYL